jgi:hemoglobin
MRWSVRRGVVKPRDLRRPKGRPNRPEERDEPRAHGRRLDDTRVCKFRHTKAMKTPLNLFARIGGEQGVKNLVHSFYDRVLKDPELAPFFENANLERLYTMQYEFFAAALGGPAGYSGLSIYKAHFGRGIEREHFDRFVNHLIDTLKSCQLSEQEISLLIARVNTYADDVTGVVPQYNWPRW